MYANDYPCRPDQDHGQSEEYHERHEETSVQAESVGEMDGEAVLDDGPRGVSARVRHERCAVGTDPAATIPPTQ